MNVVIVNDYEEMSDAAAGIVIDAVRHKPDLVLGLATGSTPEGLYRRLVDAHREDGLDFSQVVTFNLDEYVGLRPDHPQSFLHFMKDQLFNHVNVQPENVHIPDGMAGRLARHCEDYEEMIARAGGIDLQVLGIGRDGHIAFNEPGTSFGSATHVTVLTPETIEDNARFFDSPDDVPRFALTMGIATILHTRTALLLAAGENKADAVKATIEGPITSMVAASALQMHPGVVAIVDEAAASRLERRDFYRWQQESWGRIADRL